LGYSGSSNRILHNKWDLFAPILLAVIIALSAQQSHLLFHTLAEFFPIAIALIMFAVAWDTYAITRNNFLMYLACGYFWVAALNLIHTFAYEGMSILNTQHADPSMQIWMASRYLEAFLLVTAPLFLVRKLNRIIAFMAFALVAILLLALINNGYFPQTFIDGEGMTGFKVTSEYFLIAILVAALVHLWKSGALLDQRVLYLIALSIVFTAVSEAVLAFYGALNESASLIGYILKLFSFWFVYLSIVRTTLSAPYRVMARGASTYNAIPIPTVVVGHGGVILQVNQAALDALGRKEADVLKRHCHDLLHPSGITSEECPVCSNIRLGISMLDYEIELPSLGKWRSFSLTPINAPGDLRGMVQVIQDISIRKRAELELRESRSLLEEAQEMAHLGNWNLDLTTGHATWSDEEFRLLGYEPHSVEASAENFMKAVHPDDREAVQREMQRTMNPEEVEPYSIEHHVLLPDGEERVVLERGTVEFDEQYRPLRMYGTTLDITERKIMEETLKEKESHLQHLAHHDTLTGLPNRLLLLDRLNQAIAKAHRNKKVLALLFVDLDKFKQINDSLGHYIGDGVLRSVATRLGDYLREGDTLARIGGDEFTVIVESLEQSQYVGIVAQKLLRAFEKPFHLEGHEFYLTASIGVSLYPSDGKDADTLLRNADAAMYRAKDEGRNTFEFYTEDMTVMAFERVLMETSLRGAIGRNELVVHYQPQVYMDSGVITGMEALVRWLHPEMGLIAPDRFIPLAEESGLINQIGEWVLKTVCRQRVKWSESGYDPGRISVNLSGKQLFRGDLIECVRKIINDSHCNPEWLEFEITESCVMQNARRSIEGLDALRKMGITLSIDDFGTGYSSLSYLKQLPITKLKIDRSFVRDVPDNTNDVAITRAIIALGNSMQLQTIAEGVETEEQVAFLQNEGCHHAQGVLFHSPKPADEVTELLASISS
jgi:diguanylate cyclase (GGDEF)-like protein/PAS domain S-box-containing protein